MIFNKNDLTNIKFIPTKTQRLMVTALQQKDTDLTLLDPTNPFTMLLEANVVTCLNAIEETCSVSRKLFPSLANSKDDLYHHINSEEELNLFSTPSEVTITFMINVLDIRSMGIYDVNTNSYKITLPEYTEVKVSDTILTLTNDIDITLKNNQTFVEQKINDAGDISVNSLGNLYSVISVDANNVEWVIFETKLKQVERVSYEFQLIRQDPFKQEIPINDQYYYSEVFMQDNNSNWVKIDTTHTDTVYDHNTPTMKIDILDNSVRYKLPDFYTVDDSVTGIIRIDIYTTKGKMLLPLNKFNIEDFEIKLPKYFYTNESSVTKKINKLAHSRNIIDGGVTSRKTKDLRNKIIFNTTGVIDLPITEKQLNETAKLNGFTLYKAIDTITDRIFIGSKNINDVYSINQLASNIDVFNNTTEILPSSLDSSSVLISNNTVLIKSGTVFKSDNGKTTVVNDSELDILNNNTIINKSKLMKETEYYYSPFYHVLDLEGDILNSRIYDLDNPTILYMNILNKNEYLEHNVNISRYLISKTTTGYQIILSLFGNDKFKELTPESIFIQVGIKITTLGDRLFFTGTYDPVLDKYVININSTFMVDANNKLSVTNGESFIFTNKIYIDNDAEFIIYTTDNSLPRDDRYEPTLEIFNGSIDANALCKESSKLTFGKELKHLWNRITSVYTDRKYLRATEDKFLRYKADVFNTDVVTEGGVVIKNSDCTIANVKLLHKEGDIVLDANGEPLYEYRIGDTILDIYNKPIVDVMSGIIRYVDIIMLQYEYKIIKDIRYDNYIKTITEIILNWTLNDMTELNDVTLEHTQIYYKPRKSNINATLSNEHKIDNLISPEITLYMDKTVYNADMQYHELIKALGKILHKYIEKRTIVMNDIKKDIINNVNNDIVGVKIIGIETSNSEILTFKESSNRLSLKKIITQFGEVGYDIKLNIVAV